MRTLKARVRSRRREQRHSLSLSLSLWYGTRVRENVRQTTRAEGAPKRVVPCHTNLKRITTTTTHIHSHTDSRICTLARTCKQKAYTHTHTQYSLSSSSPWSSLSSLRHTISATTICCFLAWPWCVSLYASFHL